ncbi:uncharacterized protein [Spinacia oleracea]|uniref:CCHC-type domain-containing protein n=1 Tax=Spinacia oleracea TaxID=3562 RepID=A0A9R0HSM4_SPIOL|nr:uncharacterized protein LOC110775886 [Spinacia oleracea]
MVQQTEKQKEISDAMEAGIEASALSVTKQTSNYVYHNNNKNSKSNVGQNQKGFQKRETKEEKMRKYFCEHCKMKGHTKDGCFKLNGYPEWFKNPKPKGTTSYAANVSMGRDDAEIDTPLENGRQNYANMMNAVVEQIMNMLKAKQVEAGSSSTGNMHLSNFAGPF